MIDSIGLDYYWEALDAAESENFEQSQDSYMMNYLEPIRDMAAKFGVVFVFTKPEIGIPKTSPEHWRKNVTLQINLSKLSQTVYSMTLKAKEKETKLWYTIDFYGIKIVQE